MKRIILYHQYVSQQEDIKSLFLATDKNLYIKKGSTGIGGTTTILEDRNNTRVVISPTKGMIQGKEKSSNITNPNVYYIYGDSNHRWKDFIQNPSNKIVNCTPDQIIILRKYHPEWYNIVVKYPVFVDEIHQYISDFSFRDSMKSCLNLIFSEWKAKWVLSTATDNKIGSKLIDIPPGLQWEGWEVVPHNQSQKSIEVIRSSKPLEQKLILDMFHESLAMGKKLLIASNSTKIHKLVSKFLGYKVINLTGDNIRIKLSTHKNEDLIEDIDWNDVDIVVISSKYFAGFDIPIEVDVLIDTSPHFESMMIGVNDIIQIIGRSRVGVGRIVLSINLSRSGIEEKLFHPKIEDKGLSHLLTEFKSGLDSIKKDTWIEDTNLVIKDLIHYSLIYPSLLKAQFDRYAVTLTKYKSLNLQRITTIEKWPFAKRLLTLLTKSLAELKKDFGMIKKYLQFKIDGVFSPDLAILFYSVICIKRDNIQITISESEKPIRFYPKLNKILRGDEDWDLLFQWLKTKMWIKRTKISKDHLIPKWADEYLEIRSRPSIQTTKSSNSYFECFMKSMDELKSMGIIPNDYEKDKLISRCKDVFSRKDPDDFSGIRTREQLLALIGWANLYVLNGGRQSYDFPIKRNRQYNPLTQLPSPLRRMVNIKLIQLDISSANPTFIDKILGTDLHKVVYENIQNKLDIPRDKAKLQYNMYLNNDVEDPEKVYYFFNRIAGYDKDASLKLTSFVTGRKGYVYDRMTEVEKSVIETYASQILKYKTWFRFHDAIIIPENQVGNLLPRKIEYDGMEFEFEAKYYNNDKKFILT